MINILPINDLKEHTENSTCECNPSVEFENGEMIAIHNSYDGREFTEDLLTEQLALLNITSNNLKNTIYDNTQLFIVGFNKGDLNLDDAINTIISKFKN